MGPSESEAIDIYWPLYRHYMLFLSGLLPALLLLRKENRRLEAWAVLFPAALYFSIARFVSILISEYTLPVRAFIVLLTVWWLIPAGRPTRNRLLTALIYIGFAVVSGGVSWISEYGLEIPSHFRFQLFCLIYATLALTVLIALPLARWRCRRNFTWIGFTFRCLAYQAALTVLPLAIWMTVLILHGFKSTVFQLLPTNLAALVSAVTILVFFLTIAIGIPLFQKRLRDVFRVPEEAAQPPEKNDAG